MHVKSLRCCCLLTISNTLAMMGLGDRERRRVLPVTDANCPNEDDYFELPKPQRRWRVVRKNAHTTHSTLDKVDNRSQSPIDDDDEEEKYYFEFASPSRPKICPSTTSASTTRARVMNKFEAQVSPPRVSVASIFYGSKLPRKKIVGGNDDQDEDEEDGSFVADVVAGISAWHQSDSQDQQQDLDHHGPNDHQENKVDDIETNAAEHRVEDNEPEEGKRGRSTIVTKQVGSHEESSSKVHNDDFCDRQELTSVHNRPEHAKDEESVALKEQPKVDEHHHKMDDPHGPKGGEGMSELDHCPSPVADFPQIRFPASSLETPSQAVLDPSPNPDPDETKHSVQGLMDGEYEQKELKGEDNRGFEMDHEEADDDDDDDDPDDHHLRREASLRTQCSDKYVMKSAASLSMSTTKKPFLFLLHTLGSSACYWSSLTSHMASLGYSSASVDLLGHGLSSCPRKQSVYTFRSLFCDLLTIFDHYVATQGEKGVVVIAQGYGCPLSSLIARNRPNAVTCLVLCAGGGPTPLAPPISDLSLMEKVVNVLRDCCLVRKVLSLKKKKCKRIRAKGRSMRFQQSCSVPTFVTKYFTKGQVWPEGDMSFYRKVNFPTLLVHGLKDELVSLVEMCDMERCLPKAFLEILPNAGHWLVLEQPDQMARMIAKFVNKYENR